MSEQSISTGDFPLKTWLWQGSLLASIAHAIFVARAPFMAHEQSWDGRNYNVQDSAGSRGTIAFGANTDQFVAVFYVESSERNPMKRGVRDPSEADRFVRGVPPELTALRNEALQYLIQEVDGHAMPVITAAFWSDLNSAHVAAHEPWSDVMKHGAFLVKNQLLSPTFAIKQWATDLELTADQVAFAETLFHRRLAVPDSVLPLTPADLQQLRCIANGDTGFDASRESLGEIGFVFSHS